MSDAAEATHDLRDFAAFLDALESSPFGYVVIGGCAVGAYGRLNGESVLTQDLDVLVTPESMPELLTWAANSRDVTVLKRPRPRALQVAVLEWQGLEINALTEAVRLPPELTLARARIFELSGTGVEVLLADPYDLLANKLAVDRPKDRPHVEVLTRFVHEEIAIAFAETRRPRDRVGPARRLLEVTGQATLPESLFRRLVPIADHPTVRRFLVQCAPNEALARAVLATADDPEEAAELRRILEETPTLG